MKMFIDNKASSNFGLTVLLIFSTLEWPSVATNVTKIRQGSLIGATMVSRNGTEFNAYFGIPYATPPLGKLRFQPPKKAQSWNGIFNATKPGSVCVQMLFNTSEVIGTEDCLNLNIYNPKDAKAGDNIPVMVYIHGGIFKQHSNLINDPKYLMDRRIIIVIPNYRLGVLGFMSTGDAVISGNMGLKDQVLALHWVRDNIHAFGGDPNKITLHGHSSGAICVHLHTLSPLSVGLFRRVIIQSGVGNSPNSFFDRGVSKAVGRELAHRVGCNRNTSERILDCLLTKDAKLFPPTQEQMFIWNTEPDAAFRPTVEVEDAKSPFLTEVPPKSSYPTSNYEWLIGTTTGECAFKAAVFLAGDGKLAQKLDIHYRKLFPVTLQYLWTTNPRYDDEISTTIRHHYFGSKHINDTTAIPLMDMYTEELFTQPTYEAINKFSGVKYVYLYDYWANFSEQNNQAYYPRRLGISHAEELNLIFWDRSSAPFLTDEDLAVGNEIITRWINFAYSGNPNKPFPINENMFSSWQPVDTSMVQSKINFLRIKIDGSMEQNYGEQSNRFWRNIPVMSKFF